MKNIVLGILGIALVVFLVINSKRDGASEKVSDETPRVMAPEEVALAVGETGSFSNLSVTLNQFVADYRCPVDVQCIEAGAVVVNITLKAGEEELTLNKPSDEVPLEFAGHKISIVDTNPPAMSGKVIDQKDYVVTFFIEPTITVGEKTDENKNTPQENEIISKLSGTTWVWEKTIMNDDTTTVPKKPGVFALDFSADGKVSGTTDCNGFGGSYTLGADNTIAWGPFMSTLMYCDGSQEAVFTKSVSESNSVFFTEEGNLVLLLPYDSGSVIFKKK